MDVGHLGKTVVPVGESWDWRRARLDRLVQAPIGACETHDWELV